ncbi:MAG: hypothetical protein KGL52_09905 [Rhodospirillales bacterium]|nr:hypothetical protein [Rhodospirillales bacterium]
MSETKTPVLTDKQRAWANAFLRVLGGTGEVTAKTAPQLKKGKTKTPPKPELGGKLGEKEQAVGEGVRQAREKLVGKGEDVSRKTTFGRSGDKGFKTGVVAEVDKLMEAVDRQLERGGQVNEDSVPGLRELRNKLVGEQTRYREGIKGEKDEAKRAQRQKKVEAIQSRLDGLDNLIQASGKQVSEREQAVKDMTLEERAKALETNPEMMQAIVQAKPPPHAIADILLAMSVTGSAIDRMIKTLVDTHGGDAAYIETICERVVGDVVAKTSQVSTFLRTNSAATKLTKVYAETGGGKELLDDLEKDAKIWLTPSRKIEIDPTKEKDPEARKESLTSLANYLRALFRKLIGSTVAREIAITASMIAAGARKVGADPAVMVGGHVFLRVITPKLATLDGLDTNQKRAMVLATKALQNASNGVAVAKDSKEPFMRDFAEVIEEHLGDLQAWFLDIAEQGDKLRGIDDMDQEVSMGGVTRRDVLIMNLENSSLKLDDYFAAPSEGDKQGIKPLYPDTRIGALILSAGSLKPEPQGMQLPVTPLQKQSHAKLVERTRRDVIKQVVQKLKTEKPGKDEDEQ